MPDEPTVDYVVRPLEGEGEAAVGTPHFAIHVCHGGAVRHVIAWTASETEARYIVSALRREDRYTRSLGPELGRLLAAESVAASRVRSGHG